MNVDSIIQTSIPVLTQVGLKIVGAIALWIIGRWLIGLAVRMMARALDRQHFDPTLTRYTRTSLSVLLNIVLVVAILGYFGVETTTFAALLAAGGIAIGVAWAGCWPTSPPARSSSFCAPSRSATL